MNKKDLGMLYGMSNQLFKRNNCCTINKKQMLRNGVIDREYSVKEAFLILQYKKKKAKN